MEFLNFILIATVVFYKPSISIKLDKNVGSNWYPPSSNSASVSLEAAGDSSTYYNAASAYSTLGKHSSDSSLLPTTVAVAPSASNNVAVGGVQSQGPSSVDYDYTKHYYQALQHQLPAEGVAKQYQYIQQYQYPVMMGAEQRQEFFDQNPGFAGGDGGGGSVFDNFPTLGGITGGLGNAASSVAQAVGLGGLGVFGALIVAAIGIPLLVLLILFPIAILVIAILGFPVLQLTLPPSDPNLARKFKTSILDSARRAKEVLESEECIERLSCNLARKSRKLPYESWILTKLDNIPNNKWTSRISKSVKVGRAGEDCEQFKCSPATRLKKIYESYKDSHKSP